MCGDWDVCCVFCDCGLAGLWVCGFVVVVLSVWSCFPVGVGQWGPRMGKFLASLHRPRQWTTEGGGGVEHHDGPPGWLRGVGGLGVFRDTAAV